MCGVCLLPLICWLLGDWFWVILVTSLPLVLCLVAYIFVPESPRWLLSVGKVEDAEDICRKIARENKLTLTDDWGLTKPEKNNNENENPNLTSN